MHEIELKNGFLVFDPHFLGAVDADSLFNTLLVSTDWQQHYISMFGKRLAIPRLTAWHAESGATYEYSGIRACPNPWTPSLLNIKHQLEQHFSNTFNSVLINRYRSGNDSVDWHADNETELGRNPVIVSVSLGATRRFNLKHATDTDEKYTLDLNHGSALLMGGSTQHYWRHKLPKSKKQLGERINLTFRLVKA